MGILDKLGIAEKLSGISRQSGIVLSLFLFVLGCASPPQLNSQWGCSHEDFINRVSAAGECVVIDVYKSPKLETRPTLLVYVHGDGLRTKGARYFPRFFDGMPDINERNLVFVLLTRPGYSNGRERSTGNHYYYEGDAYRPHIVATVTRVINKLAQHYDASKLVVLGHSGGSAILGSGLGAHSDFVPDVALLAACNCNVRAWANHRGLNNWYKGRTLSPNELVENVSPKVKVLVVSGSSDFNTLPRFGREYADLLKKNGHQNVRYIEIDGEGHESVIRSKEFFGLLSENL